MRKIERLRREALAACEAKGHRMGRFRHWKYAGADRAQAWCVLCGAGVHLEPLYFEISGTACRDKCRPAIAYLDKQNAKAGGFYFSRDSLRFFGQKRSDFKAHVVKGRVFVQASSSYQHGDYMGESFAEFNPKTGDISSVPGVGRTKFGVREFLDSL